MHIYTFNDLKFTLKHLKHSYMFRSYDHPQGAYGVWVKGGRCVGLTTIPYLCADCLEIWKPQPPGTLSACPGL